MFVVEREGAEDVLDKYMGSPVVVVFTVCPFSGMGIREQNREAEYGNRIASMRLCANIGARNASRSGLK